MLESRLRTALQDDRDFARRVLRDGMLLTNQRSLPVREGGQSGYPAYHKLPALPPSPYTMYSSTLVTIVGFSMLAYLDHDPHAPVLGILRA